MTYERMTFPGLTGDRDADVLRITSETTALLESRIRVRPETVALDAPSLEDPAAVGDILLFLTKLLGYRSVRKRRMSPPVNREL